MAGDSEPHIWSYWRDKYGVRDALEQYYPKLSRSNPRLMVALAQIQNAEAAVEAVFRELNKDPDEE